MRRNLTTVRRMCIERLRELGDRCSVPNTQGAFYLLARLETQMTALDLVERLVPEYRVAAIPGEAFGLDEGCYLRIAFGALRRDTVAQGMDRLVEGLGEILSS